MCCVGGFKIKLRNVKFILWIIVQLMKMDYIQGFVVDLIKLVMIKVYDVISLLYQGFCCFLFQVSFYNCKFFLYI